MLAPATRDVSLTTPCVPAGAGESGKSTILKQMKLIYTKEGISKSEKEEWRVIIFNNLLDGLRMAIDAMEEMGISFQHDNTTVSQEKPTIYWRRRRRTNYGRLLTLCPR